MARIRSLKPEFWQHPIISRLPDRTQLLAIALLNHADDHGYFHGEPAIIRAACCPFREDLASVREDLARLSEVGWIELSQHPEQGVIGRVTKWSKHQRVDHPSDSKISAYFIRENLANPREKFAPDQGSGSREQGAGSREHVMSEDDRFDEFWEAYDKKEGKATAQRAWRRMSKADRDAAISGIAGYHSLRPDPKYRKIPATYLNQRTWEDEATQDGGSTNTTGSTYHSKYKDEWMADCPGPSEEGIAQALEEMRQIKAAGGPLK